MKKASRIQTAALLVVSLLLAGAVAEIVLRALDRDYNPSPERHYHPLLGWVQNPGHRYTHTVDGEEVEVVYNSLGFRDVEHALRKHPSVKRVVVIGDSFCAAVEVNLRDTFPRRLGEMLNARSRDSWEVINLGVGDFGTAQEYLALEHYGLAYQPDVVLHQIFPLNDICNNSKDLAGLCKSRKDPYRPYFVESGAELQLVSTQPLRNFLRRYLFSYRLVEQSYQQTFVREDPWVEEAEYNRLIAEAGLPPLAPLLYTYVEDEEQIEPVARGWRITELLIERIAARCRELGITYVPVVIPFHARVGEIWAQFAPNQPPPSMIQDYPERRFRALFERLNLPGVMMRDPFERHADVFFPPRGGHLNPEAHRLVAQATYQRFLENGLLTEDPVTLRELAAPQPGVAIVAPTDDGEDAGDEWGTTIEFGSNERTRGYLVDGWGEPEGHHNWTVGHRATVVIRAPPPGGPVLLRVRLNAFLVPGRIEHQTVRIFVNGEPVGEWLVSVPGLHEETLLVPHAQFADRQRIEIAFETPDAASPAAVGISQDTRTLAIAIGSLTLSEHRPDEL